MIPCTLWTKVSSVGAIICTTRWKTFFIKVILLAIPPPTPRVLRLCIKILFLASLRKSLSISQYEHHRAKRRYLASWNAIRQCSVPRELHLLHEHHLNQRGSVGSVPTRTEPCIPPTFLAYSHGLSFTSLYIIIAYSLYVRGW
jgi:hypothetical protein